MKVEVCFTTDEFVPDLTLWLVGIIWNLTAPVGGTQKSDPTSDEPTSSLPASPSEISDARGSDMQMPGGHTVCAVRSDVIAPGGTTPSYTVGRGCRGAHLPHDILGDTQDTQHHPDTWSARSNDRQDIPAWVHKVAEECD